MLFLRISAVLVGMLWPAAMLWLSPPFEMHKLIINSALGVPLGLLWYWLMAMWFRRIGLLPRDLQNAERGSPAALQ